MLIQAEAGDEELLLTPDDGFGRLLAHGLAQFHGVASASCGTGGVKCVAITHRPLAGGKGGTRATGAGVGVLVRHPESLLCTDVLLALHELGGSGLNPHSLGRYLRTHVHGGASDALSEDFVLV